MKLRAEIVIDIEAADYIAAADHQRNVQALFEGVKNRYVDASLAFRQLRELRERPAKPSLVRRPHRTGSVSVYEDD